MSVIPTKPLEQSPERRRFFSLRQRVLRLMRWERRISSWNMLWVAFVVGAMVAGFRLWLDWQVVAIIASGQTAFVLLIMVVNGRRHHLTDVMNALEERIGQAG